MTLHQKLCSRSCYCQPSKSLTACFPILTGCPPGRRLMIDSLFSEMRKCRFKAIASVTMKAQGYSQSLQQVVEA